MRGTWGGLGGRGGQGDGGGLLATGAAIIDLASTQLIGNSAGVNGGGVALGSATRLEADNARIEGNCANNGNGGGIYTTGAASLSHVRLAGNTAGQDPADGPGIGSGGGLNVRWLDGAPTSGLMELEDVLIVGNVAHGTPGNRGVGGGFVLEGVSSALLSQVTVAGNTSGGYGGAVRTYLSGNSELVNTLVFGNSAGAATGGGGFYEDSGGFPTLSATLVGGNLDSNGAVDDFYSAGGASPEPIPSEVPAFRDTSSANPLDWDLRLAIGSAGVDAGLGSDVLGADPADLGAFGGPGAGSWDLDGDGVPASWQPGPYDPLLGLDSDDLDATVQSGGSKAPSATPLTATTPLPPPIPAPPRPATPSTRTATAGSSTTSPISTATAPPTASTATPTATARPPRPPEAPTATISTPRSPSASMRSATAPTPTATERSPPPSRTSTATSSSPARATATTTTTPASPATPRSATASTTTATAPSSSPAS